MCVDKTDPLGLLFGVTHEPQGRGQSSQVPVHLSKLRTRRESQEATGNSQPRGVQIGFTSDAQAVPTPDPLSLCGWGQGRNVLKLPSDTYVKPRLGSNGLAGALRLHPVSEPPGGS